MLITPKAAEKVPGSSSGIIPSEWIYPGQFRRLAGPPPSVFVLPPDAQIGVETDWTRIDGVQLRRYELSNDVGARGVQTAYMDRYFEYRGEFDMNTLPQDLLAAANAVYAKWGMGEMHIHMFKNEVVPAQVSWDSAPTISPASWDEFSTTFNSWAGQNRPELLVDPFGGSNPATALLYPDKMVVQWQEAAIQSGLVIQESMLHPGVPSKLTGKNSKALEEQRKKMEAQIAAAIKAAVDALG